jgi:membrane protein DedA with SNARE-associated domain
MSADQYHEHVESFFTQLLHWLQTLTTSLNGTVDWVKTVDPSLRILAAAVAMFLEMFLITGLFVPGDIVLFFVAASVGSVGEGIWLAVAVAVGAMLGEVASYGFGSSIGSSSRRSRLRRNPDAVPHVSSARSFLLRRGGPAILGSRFIPLVWTVMPFVAGLAGFRFRRFVAWSAPGTVVWSALSVAAYALIAGTADNGNGSIEVLVALAVVGLVVFGVASLAQFVRNRVAPPKPEAVE